MVNRAQKYNDLWENNNILTINNNINTNTNK